MRFADLVCPVRFKYARNFFANRPIKILDIGCGNHAPTTTKHWFPSATYHGADIQNYNNDEADRLAIDHFYELTADGLGYEVIPDHSYDFIIMNHVIEHIQDQETILKVISQKLAPGGLIWIAFPSVRSLGLPSAIGTLQFCDDATHVRVCDVKDVANWLLDGGVKVVVGGRSYDLPRYLVGVFMLPLALILRALTGKMKSRGLWYILGFEDCVIGLRPMSK